MKLFNLTKISNFKCVSNFIKSKLVVFKNNDNYFLVQRLKPIKKDGDILLSSVLFDKNEAIQFIGVVLRELYTSDEMFKTDDEIIEAFVSDLNKIK